MANRQQTGRLVNRSLGLGAFLAAIGGATYMLWIGVTGQPIPTWFLMLATVF